MTDQSKLIRSCYRRAHFVVVRPALVRLSGLFFLPLCLGLLLASGTAAAELELWVDFGFVIGENNVPEVEKPTSDATRARKFKGAFVNDISETVGTGAKLKGFNCNPVKITRRVDKISALLLQRLLAGASLPDSVVVYVIERFEGAPRPVVEFRFGEETRAFVTQINTTFENDSADIVETVEISYLDLEVETYETSKTGNSISTGFASFKCPVKGKSKD